jgi:hypothetical protein
MVSGILVALPADKRTDLGTRDGIVYETHTDGDVAVGV